MLLSSINSFCRRGCELPESIRSTVLSNHAQDVWQHPRRVITLQTFVTDMVRKGWIRIAVFSAFVLIPCFWQQRIEAGDLRSHVYNAWLVQLIQRGQAPGLWLATQRNNVLFDYLLSGLASIFRLAIAARLATGIAVLIVFWGAFAFMRVIAVRTNWTGVPLLLAIAYGWTFQEGFLNFYLSLGLAFAGLALFLLNKPWRWAALAVFTPLVYLAHPLGVAWMLAAAFYLTVLQLTSPRLQGLLLFVAIVSIFALRVLLQSYFRIEFPPTSTLYNMAFYNGFDQLILARRYILPVFIIAVTLGVGLLAEIQRNKGIRVFWLSASKPLHLYLLSLAAVWLLPNAIYFPQYPVPVSALTTRLTSISAVLLCAILVGLKPAIWRIPVLISASAIFFFFLYQDTATLNRMEDQITSLVSTLPAGQRVISTIGGPPSYRFSTKHMQDYSCIGRCFSYGNYEAPSNQFRIRASAGNPFVVSDIRQATLMEEGRYTVQPSDLPIYQIYQCSPDWTQLCLRSLSAGERNDLYGVHAGQAGIAQQK